MTGEPKTEYEDRLKAVTREEVYRELYHGCTESFIGTGLPNQTTGRIKNFLPLPAGDPEGRGSLTEKLNACGHNTEYNYFKVNPFKKNVLTATANEPFAGDGYLECAHYIDSYITTGKPPHMRLCNYSLKFLTGMMVDLDVGRPEQGIDLTAEEAVAKVFRLADSNELPCPQFIAFSGRGANMLYLVRNPENCLPYDYSLELLEKWKTVSETMEDKLEAEGLHPDHMMINPGQSFKAPDSFHPKTGKKIQYYRVIGSDCFLDLEIEPARPVKKAKSPEKKETEAKHPENDCWEEDIKHEARIGFGFGKPRKGNRPASARSALAIANDLELIAEKRGGFPKGLRTKAVFFFYHSWYRSLMITSEGNAKESKAAAKKKALEFNKGHCTPPLPKEDYPKFEARIIQPRSDRLIKKFNVTKREMTSLKLKTISYEEIKLKQREGEQRKKSKAIKEERNRKHEEVIRLFKERYSKVEISKLTGYSRMTVSRIIKKASSIST